MTQSQSVIPKPFHFLLAITTALSKSLQNVWLVNRRPFTSSVSQHERVQMSRKDTFELPRSTDMVSTVPRRSCNNTGRWTSEMSPRSLDKT